MLVRLAKMMPPGARALVHEVVAEYRSGIKNNLRHLVGFQLAVSSMWGDEGRRVGMITHLILPRVLIGVR
jgi:hypothetical protein